MAAASRAPSRWSNGRSSKPIDRWPAFLGQKRVRRQAVQKAGDLQLVPMILPVVALPFGDIAPAKNKALQPPFNTVRVGTGGCREAKSAVSTLFIPFTYASL